MKETKADLEAQRAAWLAQVEAAAIAAASRKMPTRTQRAVTNVKKGAPVVASVLGVGALVFGAGGLALLGAYGAAAAIGAVALIGVTVLVGAMR